MLPFIWIMHHNLEAGGPLTRHVSASITNDQYQGLTSHAWIWIIPFWDPQRCASVIQNPRMSLIKMRIYLDVNTYSLPGGYFWRQSSVKETAWHWWQPLRTPHLWVSLKTLQSYLNGCVYLNILTYSANPESLEVSSWPLPMCKNTNCYLSAVLQRDINARPAPKTSVDRCCATPCRAAAPPRDSASMVERMLWRQVSARDWTRCILKEPRKRHFSH